MVVALTIIGVIWVLGAIIFSMALARAAGRTIEPIQANVKTNCDATDYSVG
jgi:hypothetical protein